MYAKYRGEAPESICFLCPTLGSSLLFHYLLGAYLKNSQWEHQPSKEIGLTSKDIEIVVGTAFVAAVFNAVLKRLTSGIQTSRSHKAIKRKS